jgi:hypothetical protein
MTTNPYESKRVVFSTLEKRYKEYLKLYKILNNGSLEGASNFVDFYWHQTYYSKYPTNV